MEKTLFQLQDAMQEITNECNIGGIQLCDLHATTLLRIVASNIQNIRLTWTYESLHLGMVFHHVDDAKGNSINWMKYWHESMFKHTYIRRKRDCE